MDSARHEAFQKLRPPCVELSSVSLRFRGNLARPGDVLKALEEVHRVLTQAANKDWLDEKLAEYAFFPLSQIFNQTQRLSVRCVELAVKSLQLLIEKGWRQKLSAPMGKQLMILMTILAGGVPAQNQAQSSTRPQSEELTVAAYDCIGALCGVLQGGAATSTIFNEVGTATIVDQAIYVLLEGILEGPSDAVQMSAANALQLLQSRITDRVVLASLLPRTVSTLTKALRPTTQTRRSFKLLSCCLNILIVILDSVLNDGAISSAQTSGKKPAKQSESNGMALDDSWLKATASQVKLALANIIPLRTHEKLPVRRSLLELCLMVIERCPTSLSDALPMMVETVIALAEPEDGGDAYNSLKQLVLSSESVTNNLKSSLHTWIIALPRVMQSNDDLVKQRAIRHISVAFQAATETDTNSEILDETMATTLCESVAAAIQSSSKSPQQLPSTSNPSLELALGAAAKSQLFPPVLVDHRSQKGTLSELNCMIKRLSHMDTSLSLTRSMMDRLYSSSDVSAVAPFWLTLSLLRNRAANTVSLSDMLNLDAPTLSSSQAGLIEELYSISLPILVELPTANPEEWRIPALALEAVALQAQQLGESFRPELIDILYPVLQLMGSSNPSLQNHAMTCLNIMADACEYSDTSTMLVDNVDYLINSVGMKFNTFDISHQAPQVLLMMIRLCGARLIPYLDDLIGSIFSILDAFHGYPKLVELLFEVLGTIVDESAKSPDSLRITSSTQTELRTHGKHPHKIRTVSDVASEIKRLRERRAEHDSHEAQELEAIESHPTRPWKRSRYSEHAGEENEAVDDQPPKPEDDSKTLSKPHNLLLSILKSIPPHLSSPSPHLRRSLLSILSRAMAVLAPDENSFLPLINDIWPSVCVRISLPPILASDTSTSLATPNPRTSGGTNEMNLQEQTYVIVASCKTVAAMCEGAGDFMSSRIEHEFPKWKQIYLRCWERVKHDAELAFERYQQRQRLLNQSQAPELDATKTISQMGHLSITETHSSNQSTSLSAPKPTTGSAQSLPPPPLPHFTSKSFTPHHNIWSALSSLFTTILSHTRLPLDIGDEICQCLGTWISFFYPNYYFTHSWQDLSRPSPADKTQVTDSSSSEVDIDATIRAMDTWNADLAWFIFVRGRAKNVNGGKEADFDVARRKMEAKLVKILDSSPRGSREVSQLRFAEVAF
ncbi:HEAT repeat protein [Coccidioides immitis RS]|uniref:HEAT repeat protein n=1 Tax=Coccidioides immitis (strain RS) TaxID=246410 RepID=J3KHS2_COCIM|nr:HEAT repeat protein [Coccidioides immitis RS]EAS35442.3 HEAT repeat protein [Coccidioides immitis RS]